MKNKYTSKFKEYFEKYKELNMKLFDARVNGLEKSVEDGTLNKLIKIAIPTSMTVSTLGIATNNKFLEGLGMGSLIMEAIYSLALTK